MATPEERKQRRANLITKRRSHLSRSIMVVFLIVIFGLTIAGLARKDKVFSEQENRNLQQLPKLTLAGLEDKSWMDDIEAYFADQFIGRDVWVAVKTRCDWLMGKREFNGVVLCKDNYLMQLPADPDEETVEKNIQAINDFADSHKTLNVNMVLAPNAVYTLSDKLPSGVPVRDQEADFEWINSLLSSNVNNINIFDDMKEHADQDLYYKTDHHWTTLGAMYGFLGSAKELGITSPYKSYEAYTVTDDFEGTLASTSGYHIAKDTIDVYAVEGKDFKYIVYDSDNDTKRSSLYSLEALETKSKYEVFFGGNHAEVVMSMVSESDDSLLVFKDSYANAYVPFLIPYYKQIIMIDPRYYYDSVDMLIDNYNITDVLFMYNMDTFLGDNSLADVLTE